MKLDTYKHMSRQEVTLRQYLEAIKLQRRYNRSTKND